MTCLFLTIEASSGDPVNHSFMVWCFGQRAACEIGSLKLSDLEQLFPGWFFFHLLMFKWSGFSASLQDFLVAELREQRGTRTSLALLQIKKTWNWHPQFQSSKALEHVPVSNVRILLLTSIEVLGAYELSTCRSAFQGLRFCRSCVRVCASICRQECQFAERVIAI